MNYTKGELKYNEETFREMYKALKEAKLQLEYLNEQQKRPTTNAVLTRIEIALAKAESTDT